MADEGLPDALDRRCENLNLEVYKFNGPGDVALSMYNKVSHEGLELLLVSGDHDFVLRKDGMN
nr:hypothetical protein [Tanacetum cinerariifolium]